MTPAQEPFLIAEVAIDATDETIRTLTGMLARARVAGRHKHFVCSVAGLDPATTDPWSTPAFAGLCRRLLAAGFARHLDFSTLHPPGQPDHLQAGFGGLEIWLASRGQFGQGVPKAAVIAAGRLALAEGGGTVAVDNPVTP